MFCAPCLLQQPRTESGKRSSSYFSAYFFFFFWLARSRFPDQGLNPGHRWKPGILTTKPPRNSLTYLLLDVCRINDMKSRTWYPIVYACMGPRSLQLCLNLCNAMDCNPQGSSVQGILQARMLECIVMPSSRGSSQYRDWTHVSSIFCIGGQVLYH